MDITEDFDSLQDAAATTNMDIGDVTTTSSFADVALACQPSLPAFVGFLLMVLLPLITANASPHFPAAPLPAAGAAVRAASSAGPRADAPAPVAAVAPVEAAVDSVTSSAHAAP